MCTCVCSVGYVHVCAVRVCQCMCSCMCNEEHVHMCAVRGMCMCTCVCSVEYVHVYMCVYSEGVLAGPCAGAHVLTGAWGRPCWAPGRGSGVGTSSLWPALPSLPTQPLPPRAWPLPVPSMNPGPGFHLVGARLPLLPLGAGLFLQDPPSSAPTPDGLLARPVPLTTLQRGGQAPPVLWTVVTTGCHSSDPSAVDLGTRVTP